MLVLGVSWKLFSSDPIFSSPLKSSLAFSTLENGHGSLWRKIGVNTFCGGRGSFLKGTWLQLSSVSSGSENWLETGRNHDFSFWQQTSAFSICAFNLFCLSQEKPLLSAHSPQYFATDPSGSGPCSHHCGFGAHYTMTSTFSLNTQVSNLVCYSRMLSCSLILGEV